MDEIWDANTSTFNRNTLSKLYKYITGNENAGVDTTTLNKITEMAENATTSADIRANVVDGKTSSQDVIVRFGGLDWQVVYLSQNDNGFGKNRFCERLPNRLVDERLLWQRLRERPNQHQCQRISFKLACKW